jgi:YD repeat-containing protein
MESDHARAGQGGRGGWCAPHERRHLVPCPQEAERIGVPPADHSYATTTYAWNANDTLATTTDGDGNVRHFTYDGRGLRLTAEDLHDTGDGTFGNWTYSYDNGGNLSSFVDPKSQTVNFTYDGLNRVLTENYTGQAGTEIEYGYDACTNGKTRLCSATSTDAVSTTTYNALGLPATTTMAIDNAYYTTAYRYDRQGNMANIVYPDNSEVQYTFNTAGLPDKVQQKESGGSFADIVSNFEYGPHGQVTYKLFGNNVESTYTFGATKLYRLRNILTVASSSGESLGFFGGGELLGQNPERHPLAVAFLDATDMPASVRDLLDDVHGGEHVVPDLPGLGNTPTTTLPETPRAIVPIDLAEIAPEPPSVDTPVIEPMPSPPLANDEQSSQLPSRHLNRPNPWSKYLKESLLPSVQI